MPALKGNVPRPGFQPKVIAAATVSAARSAAGVAGQGSAKVVAAFAPVTRYRQRSR